MNTSAAPARVSKSTRSFSRTRSSRPTARRRLNFGTTGIVGPGRSLARNTHKTTPGFPLGGKTAKTHTTFFNEDSVLAHTVRVLLIDDIAKGDGINERERDIVQMVGWKIRLQCQNTYDIPITMRMAVISPRQTFGANATQRAIALLRGFGPSRSDSLDVGNSGIINTNNKINDDLYMVLYEGSAEVGPDAGSTGYSGGIQPNWAYFEKWVPLKKQFRYAATTSGKSETPVYFIYWFDTKIRKQAQAFTAISGTGVVKTTLDAIAYFHDRE